MTSPNLLFTLTIVTSSVGLTTPTSTNQYDAYRVYEDLFVYGFYRKEVRPVSEYEGPLYVYIKYSLISMIELDEKSQTMETASRLELDWTDSFLKWDLEDYGNIEATTVLQENIWLPDVVVENSVEKHQQLGYKQLPVRVYSDGQVLWTPSIISKTQCDIIVTYYPFDTQKCDIEIATEVSLSSEIYLYIWTSTPVVTDDYSEDGSWKLVGTAARNVGSDDFEDKKSKIIFSVLLERRNTFYIVSIIAPVVLLSLTASLVFALPADSGEKMSTGITVLLAFAVYLTIISDYLPDTSLQTSILAIYLTLLLGLSAFSVLITTFILRLHHSEGPVGPKTKGLVRFIRALTCKSGRRRAQESEVPQPDYENIMPRSKVPSAPYIMYSKSRENLHVSSVQSSRSESTRQSNDDNEEEITWRKVAQTIDWFLFIFFTTAVITITVVCVVTMVIGGEKYKPTIDDATADNQSDISDAAPVDGEDSLNNDMSNETLDSMESGDPSVPSDPGDPSDNNYPFDPIYPNDPMDSNDPSNSNDPSDPNDQSNSNDSIDPNDPSNSNDPSDPNDPSNSNDPSDPSEPSDPVDVHTSNGDTYR